MAFLVSKIMIQIFVLVQLGMFFFQVSINLWIHLYNKVIQIDNNV